MKFIWNSVVEEIVAEGTAGVTSVRIKDINTNEVTDFPTDGVFIFIGHEPNTGLFKGQLDLDDKGYMLVDRNQQTSVPGVFAGGDVQDHVFRQAITAAGTGAAAAIQAERFLAEHENRAYPGHVRA